MKLIVHKGGAGSGNFNHEGRPGHEGGSASTTGEGSADTSHYQPKKRLKLSAKGKQQAEDDARREARKKRDEARKLKFEMSEQARNRDASGFVKNQSKLASLEKHPPKLPAEIGTGPMGKVQARRQERAAAMEAAYPGVKFSPAANNPESAKQGKKLGIPGIGVPRAIFDGSVDAVSDETIVTAVRDAFKQHSGGAPYVSYTTLKYATGLPFKTVFGVVKHMREIDPQKTTMTVDRLGKNIAVRFL